MAIKITENGVVNYENSPDVNRKLFPNLNICGKEINELADEIDGKAPLIVNTASGSIASFDNGSDDMPLKSCVVSIEPIQEGSGDPSPENVRPISGRTGLTISHSRADTSDPITISVNWQTEAGTMYGGSLDVVSGKLVVDRAIVDLGSLNWNIVEWNNIPAFASRDLRNSAIWIGNISTIPNLLCSGYTKYTRTYLYNHDVTGVCYANNNQNPDIMIRDSRFTDVESFRNGVNGITLVYDLKTPTEIKLTPQEVRTFLGENNIWSDGGDVSVEYPADTKTYIDAFSIKTVEVSGQTPTITAEENTRYICGEVTSLTFTPCESGICDVRFTAASISTVLAMPETVKLPDWFDPTLLEANTTYEINIVDGIYGVVMSWA